MSDNTIHPADDDVTTDTFMPYSSLKAEQRGLLMAGIDMSDTTAAMARLTELNSDVEVSEEDAKVLGWITTYTLGLSTHKRDKVVTRAKRRGRIPNLDSFIASLNGDACNIDPDTVVYIRDEAGDEVTTVVGRGDDKERKPLVDVRGTATLSGVFVRLDTGEVFPLANGKRATAQDVGGDENYRRIAEFSRDGGETFQPVRWTLTLPNKAN